MPYDLFAPSLKIVIGTLIADFIYQMKITPCGEACSNSLGVQADLITGQDHERQMNVCEQLGKVRISTLCAKTKESANKYPTNKK